MPVYKRAKKDNFAMIGNALIEATNISALAFRILVFAISRPENWIFSVAGIAHFVKEGKDAVSRALTELEEKGFLIRSPSRCNGRFKGYDYFFFEDLGLREAFLNEHGDDKSVMIEPELEKPDSENSDLEISQTAISDVENRDVYNIININKNFNNINISNILSINPEEVRDRVKSRLEIDCLRQEYDSRYLDNLVSLITDVYLTGAPTIRLGKDNDVQTQYLRERFDRLGPLHVEQVLRSIERDNPTIYNVKGYFLSALLNAVNSLDLGYGYGEY